MSKMKHLARFAAAAILATGLATTSLVAGSSGPASAVRDIDRHQPVPTETVDDGGFTINKLSDTGWG